MWDSLRRRLAFSKYLNRSPFSSPSKYHESPSGLLIPDALSLSPSQSVRFGDIWSNDWMGFQYIHRCPHCGANFGKGTNHWCSGVVVNTTGQNTILSPPSLFSSSQDPATCLEPLPVVKRTMPVIGYRAWSVDQCWELGYGTQLRLRSTGINHNWTPGINAARCGGYDRCHAAPLYTNSLIPNEHHHCGLYVVADADSVQKHIKTLGQNHVVGAVLGWGKVVQHGNEGWRAQYARVIALMDMKFNEANDEIANRISQAYGVPIVERPALERYVSEFGDPAKG